MQWRVIKGLGQWIMSGCNSAIFIQFLDYWKYEGTKEVHLNWPPKEMIKQCFSGSVNVIPNIFLDFFGFATKK